MCSNVDTPRFVDAMKGKRVVDAECGSSHSACILDDGSLYTWGKGRYGRLGHNDYETQYKPKQVRETKAFYVVPGFFQVSLKRFWQIMISTASY